MIVIDERAGRWLLGFRDLVHLVRSAFGYGLVEVVAQHATLLLNENQALVNDSAHPAEAVYLSFVAEVRAGHTGLAKTYGVSLALITQRI